MRIKARMVFGLENKEIVRRILDSLGLETDERSKETVTLFIDDPKYNQLKNGLLRRGIEPFEVKEKYFEKKELARAELFNMAPAGYWGYPQPDVNMEDWQRASYDIGTACPLCGFGAVQNRPYFVKGTPKFGRNDILALNWTYEFLITERLRKLIDQAGLRGAEFWPLIEYRKNTPIEGFYQLHVLSQLPPMSPSTEIVDQKLPVAGPKRCSCGKFGRNLALDQVYGVGVPIIYKRESVKGAKDFNLTSEWLGLYDAGPWVIVSHKVYDLFEKHDIKRVGFEPVIIED
jgi:hypothetical protein